MARVIAIGQPANDSEREAIAYLRDQLPNTFTVIHNFELRQGLELFEIDIALLAPHCVFVVDVKGTRGLIDVYGSKWYPEGRAPYHSPLAILRKHAKALKSFICDQNKANTALRGTYVDAAVLLTAPDAHVVDPGGQDAPSVAYLKKSAAFFQDRSHVPGGFAPDIRAHLSVVEKTITGKAKPRNAPPCYGNWQVEEKLGGNDRYTEYRAKHTLLGARRGGTARLRVYHVDPYLPEEERKRARARIGNAFRAVASLPGHPNILTVREFFPTEAEDRLVLVTEDVPGHALRQHIRKGSLALTYDQKIGVIRDVLAALDHAHRSEPQVVHRNLTPDAVVVASSGRALLCAFDYARAGKDRTSTIAAEIVDDLDPLYQAPECYKDPSKASVASDLFAAGFVFYELLVGEPPFSSIDDMMEKDGLFPVKPSQQRPDLPQQLDDWLQELCRFDAEDRPSSAALALARFNDIVGPDPREAAKAKPEPSIPKALAKPTIDYENLPRDFVLANRFRIEERLGRGGFAVAYKVFDAFSDTVRVLKLIVKDRRSTFERLRQEYRALERLKPHPNVVEVTWADQLPDETPYIVFEYLPGSSVAEMIDRQALSVEDARRVADETAAGLEHLHASGVFHRDIKPSNLLWTDHGVRIIDFNVAALKEDADARAGGTRRYLPPDLDLAEPPTTQDEVDRDLYALGITLYECVTASLATGIRYPWSEPAPPPGVAPRDPRDHVPDLAPEFAALILQTIAPNRSQRFASAADFRKALAAVTAAKKMVAIPAPPVPSTPGIAVSVLAPTKPDFNPFVSGLLAMYSQSPRTNAGTRGLDDIGRATYVSTLLDEKLLPAVLSGEHRLVIITGNAGDGKTAFIQQLEARTEVAPTLKRHANGSRFTWRGRQFVTNYDGSQDEDTKLNDEVLTEFFGAYQGAEDGAWPTTETRIIAINEGRLIDFLTERQDKFPKLIGIVRAGLFGSPPTHGVVAVNLNLRAVVADPAETGLDSIFDRLLRRLTDEKFWEPCGTCDIRDRCYVYHNARTFMEPVAGPKVGQRIRELYTITHLRGRLHITMRDLRSAVAFTLAGTRDCDEIHALYASGTPDARRAIMEGYYFNAWRGGAGSKDRLLSLFREIDVGEASNPDMDRALDYLSPGANEMARFSFDGRGNYDSGLLDRAFRELPRDATGSAARRVAMHQEYVGMLRRRQYFERRDERWREMLPYRTAEEFWELIRGKAEPASRLEGVLLAINRGEGLTDPKRLGDTLALRVRNVERGTIRSYRLFPGKQFRLARPEAVTSEFVEHVPQALRLLYVSSSGQQAELAVNLDIFEMLGRLNEGYRPSVEELQGYYLSLAVFKNVLASAPYQEVLLTRSGHDFFRVARDSEGTLHMEPLQGEAR